ncbi:hypothetical protein FRC03_007075 [Tulasnella sp. 419]|nr:hypothetical protein FRC03_007075 [Tulasnella sp. 419]
MTRSWSGSIAPPTHSFDGIDIPGRKRMSLPTQKSTGMDRHQRSQSIPASQRIPMHFLMSTSSLSLQSPSLRSPSSVSLQSPMSQFRSPSTTSLHSPGFQLRSPSNVSLHSPSSNLRSPSNVSLHSPGSNLRSPSNVSLLPPGAAPAQWSQRLDSQAEEGSESTHTHHAPTNLSQRPPLSPLISPSAVSLLPPGAAPASPVGPLPIFGRDLTELDLLVARIDDPETRNGANYEALLALGEILGPAPGSIAHDVPAITPMPELNLPESPVKVARRRLTKDGKIRVKLTLKNHPVERCGICLAQFKEGDAGTWLKCKHPYVFFLCLYVGKGILMTLLPDSMLVVCVLGQQQVERVRHVEKPYHRSFMIYLAILNLNGQPLDTFTHLQFLYDVRYDADAMPVWLAAIKKSPWNWPESRGLHHVMCCGADFEQRNLSLAALVYYLVIQGGGGLPIRELVVAR